MSDSHTAAPVRFALIGTGGIAQRHIDAAVERPDAIEFVSACDPNEAALAHTRTRLPGIRTYPDVDELVAAGGFDAAVVATPHFLHLPQAAAVARTGKAVLVEKPAVVSTAQARELREIADASGAIVVAGQTRRYAPDIARARELMSSPSDFGRLRTFDITSLQDIRSFTRPGQAHWLLDGALAGGGVAISNAIHQIDMVRFLAGADYTAVMASASFEDPFVNGAESAASVVFELSNGAHGTMHADYLATRSPFSEAVVLVGEHGSLAQHTTRLGDYRGPLSYATSGGVRSTAFEQQHQGWQLVLPDHAEEGQEAFTAQLVHFAAVVRGDETSISSLEDNFNTIAVIEAIVQSARSGGRVEVPRW